MTVEIAGRGPQLSGVVGFFLALSTISIILRCYCRWFVVKNFGLDDWFALIAWLLFVIFSTFAILGVYHGTGQHAALLPPAEIPIGLKWWWACEPVYVLSNMALKLSISIMLLRIAVSRMQRIVVYTVLVVIELYSTFFVMLFLLQCRPSAYFWTRYTGGKGTCMNPNTTVIATYIFSAISCWADWTLGIIPIFMVWNLQMNSRTKLSVAAILALGAIASTATIVRIPYIHGLSNQQDFLYATTDVAIWSACETGIGIAASAIATLRPLFRPFFARSRLFGGTSSHVRTNPWPAAGMPGGGYMKSRELEELRLRDDTGRAGEGVGVTTIIRSDGDLEQGIGMEKMGRKSLNKTRDGTLKKKRCVFMGGSGNGTAFRDDTSSEEEVVGWSETRDGSSKKGITKTVVTDMVGR